MNTQLPSFRYHPDPLSSGVFEVSEEKCACCGVPRGYIYVGPVYGEQDLDSQLCPWCIADGSAAAKLGASFADSYSLARAGISESIVEEVNLRTPGYSTWQQEEWLAHCDDACEFRGDISREELKQVPLEVRLQLFGKPCSDGEWQTFIRDYSPGGPVAVYKFVCRHCGQLVLGMDAC